MTIAAAKASSNAPKVASAVVAMAAGLALFCVNAPAAAGALDLPNALTGQPGDPIRGKAIATNPRAGLCVLCHAVAGEAKHSLGNIAGPLDGAGARWSEPQLRARLVNARTFNPDTVMPAFHELGPMASDVEARDRRVGQRWRNQPILTAQEIEDVLAWLVGLK